MVVCERASYTTHVVSFNIYACNSKFLSLDVVFFCYNDALYQHYEKES